MDTLSLYILALLPIMVSSQSHSYIVHMDSSHKPTPFSDHHIWYLASISSLSEDANAETKLIHTYTEAIQGFSALLTLSELQALTSTPGFVSYSRNRPLKLMTTHSPQFLGLNPNYGAWPVSNYGEDVIIGLLDSGVWPESGSYSDQGMTPVPSRWKGTCVSNTQFNSSYCNNKLIGARFYNKGYMAENPDKKISMHSVRDTNGHGTHTSSTAAGNYIKGASYFGYASGTAKGMSPRARLAIYKVAWFGVAYQSDLVAGVDQAIRDGVDILSISLGFLLGADKKLDDDPIAVATFAAMKKGIFVAAAAGNDGPEYGTLGNRAPWVAVVGAGTTDRKLGGVLTLGNGFTITYESLYLGVFTTDTQYPLVFNSSCQSTKELEGNILVCINDPRISIQDQIYNSVASATVFITNTRVSDLSAGSFYPAAFVSDQDGKMLINYIKNVGNPTAALKFKKTFTGRKPAPMVDVYSSRGPFLSCLTILKPDIIAPGTSILASWSTISSASPQPWHPLFSNFYLAQGTSMATPHVAGVAALLKSVHPDWSPAAIRSALMTTANPVDNNDRPITDAHGGLIASPLAIGAGHINPNKALNPGLVYDAVVDDYKKLLCAMNYTAKQIQTVIGSRYRCSNRSNTELNYPSFIAYFDSNGSNSAGSVVQEFRRTLTNVGDEESSYFVTLTSMAGLKLKVEPQRLVFKKKYEKLRYKLTMVGPKLSKDYVLHGSLSWTDDGGNYVVRSPIVATNIVMPGPEMSTSRPPSPLRIHMIFSIFVTFFLSFIV